MTLIWFCSWWLQDFQALDFASVSAGDLEMWLVFCVALDLLFGS